MPGEVNITSMLIGPENRTLAVQVVQQTDNQLDLILEGFDIVTFSNETAYDLNFTQVDGTDIDEYFITAMVSLTLLYSLMKMLYTYLYMIQCVNFVLSKGAYSMFFST